MGHRWKMRDSTNLAWQPIISSFGNGNMALYLCPGERTEPFMRQDRKTAVCSRSTGVRIITQELAENDAKKKLPGVDDTGETC